MGAGPSQTMASLDGLTTAVAHSCGTRVAFLKTSTDAVIVRAGPGSETEARGRFPPQPSYAPISVSLLGADRGWFLVHSDGGGSADTPEMTFAGLGWVQGETLSLRAQGTEGLLAPQDGAAVVMRPVKGGTLGSDALFDAGRLTDCRHDAVQLQWSNADVGEAAMRSLRVDAHARKGLPRGLWRAWFQLTCAFPDAWNCGSVPQPMR
jgi:hypothetical protein